jgi:hypothetical protein
LLYGWLLLPHLCTPHAPITPIAISKEGASIVLLVATETTAQLTVIKLDNPFGRLR